MRIHCEFQGIKFLRCLQNKQMRAKMYDDRDKNDFFHESGSGIFLIISTKLRQVPGCIGINRTSIV
jgi:hypothetical protein